MGCNLKAAAASRAGGSGGTHCEKGPAHSALRSHKRFSHVVQLSDDMGVKRKSATQVTGPQLQPVHVKKTNKHSCLYSVVDRC